MYVLCSWVDISPPPPSQPSFTLHHQLARFGGKGAVFSLAYLKERFCVSPVLAGGIVKERGETELGVVGDQLLSETLTALRERVEDERMGLLPTREMGGARGGVKTIEE